MEDSSKVNDTEQEADATKDAKSSPSVRGNGVKRKRGRPRFEIHDGSAADRRRTQIREAQRAYRQRREGALDELRTQVSELEGTIYAMNKAFVDFCDRLTASGLSAESMQDIRETSAHFRALTKVVRKSGEEDGSEMSGSLEPCSGTSTADGPTDSLKDSGFVPLDIAMLDGIFGNETEDDRTTNWTGWDQQSQALVSSGTLYSTSSEHLSPVPVSINPPITYSFQETTFGRRLHRSCLEQSYQLILDPNQRPGTYQQVFELPLLRRDKSDLTSALKSTLRKGSHECLHSSLPLIHIGGAGTHYPRRDSFGNLRPKREAYNLGVIGPQMLAILEQAALQNLTTDMTVEVLGYEGEWLDSYDVEGYLNEQGIFIDPTSSFAEIEVPHSRPIISGSGPIDASIDSWVDILSATDRSLHGAQEKRTTTIDVTRLVNREY
ncbi:hypothetical protein PRZ48_012770 [Zasmidium cellare]|uniref:BZIP domain-containing protein n=1 Tax=Zasmidium cellare TaxID=395010 RepID=A0ABR0E5T1_ZASCE|nr:hypothetical protein PRZ48_012770 [Zasmidium cellare]